MTVIRAKGKGLRGLGKAVHKYIVVVFGISLVMGGAWLLAQAGRPEVGPTSDAAVRERILLYVRAKFGVPDSVKLTADPLRPFTYAGFLETTITADDGKQKHPNSAFVTKDSRYLILGNLYTVVADPASEIVQHVREQFKVPVTSGVTAGPLRSSPYPNLLATAVTVEDGKQKQTQDFYVTRDNRCLVVGSVFDLGVDPRREALGVITTANQPGHGSANAPVTVVEFSDLQCPMCARVHDFLEKELRPKYGDKVRVVYKEFPLASIHNWSVTGSIANQCAYQINPATYVPYRSLIFKNQSGLNAANARDLLLDYGEQVGLDRLRLAACIDAKASLPRVEENFREGQAVGVTRTPTCFVNGTMVVGLESADAFYKVVDEALRVAKQRGTASSSRGSSQIQPGQLKARRPESRTPNP
jgi:protein-disulfide isomerase